MGKKKNGWINRYYFNKNAAIGETICCPICCKEFTKTSEEHTFCRVYCKNEFWKRERNENGYYTKYNELHPERYVRLARLGFTSEEREENLETCLSALRRVYDNKR